MSAADPGLLSRIYARTKVVRGHRLWTGYVTKGGHGQVRWRQVDGDPAYRVLYVHRLAYQARRGPIPKGHQVISTCGNRLCVTHLKAVPNGEAQRRGQNRRWAAAA